MARSSHGSASPSAKPSPAVVRITDDWGRMHLLADDGGALLKGTLAGEDGATGEAWSMAYWLPRHVIAEWQAAAADVAIAMQEQMA